MTESVESKRLEFVTQELRSIKGGLENAMALASKVNAPADRMELDALLWRLQNLKEQVGVAMTLTGGEK